MTSSLYLYAADALWTALVSDDDADGTSVSIDGLDSRQVIDRLHEVIYELLCAITGLSAETPFRHSELSPA
jgi:enoyl reductase-like protein